MTAPHPLRIAREAAEELGARLEEPPELAVVLGSGWSDAARDIGDLVGQWPMTSFAGFPEPSVPGHEGHVRASRVAGHPVVWMAGRSHLYEGRSAHEVAHAVRTAVLAGAHTVVLTNAAGAVDATFRVGQPVLVRDHLNLTGCSPLAGAAPPPGFGPRFVDLTDLYSSELRRLARTVAPDMAEGVYAALPGPHYETPAEIAMLRKLGADLAGMSTVLEAIAARHLGASVLALSLVTNMAAGVSPTPLDHAEVIAAGQAAVPVLQRLLERLLAVLAQAPRTGRPAGLEG